MADQPEIIPPMSEAERQMRQNAVNIANQRAKEGASVHEVLKQADEVLRFLQGGGQVAAPGK
jgi:hypothetical protein